MRSLHAFLPAALLMTLLALSPSAADAQVGCRKLPNGRDTCAVAKAMADEIRRDRSISNKEVKLKSATAVGSRVIITLRFIYRTIELELAGGGDLAGYRAAVSRDIEKAFSEVCRSKNYKVFSAHGGSLELIFVSAEGEKVLAVKPRC
jgi:hypothetical protein